MATATLATSETLITGRDGPEPVLKEKFEDELYLAKNYVLYSTRWALFEGLICFLVAVFIVNAYIPSNGYSRDDQCNISALTLFAAFLFYAGSAYIIPTTAIGNYCFAVQKLKKRSTEKVVLMLSGFFGRISCMFLGSIGGVYLIRARYDSTRLAAAAAQFLWTPTSVWTQSEAVLWVAFANVIFNYAVYYCSHRTNVDNYIQSNVDNQKLVYSDHMVVVGMLKFPVVVAVVYWLILQFFSQDIGDPIQIGIYVALYALTAPVHATWVIVMGALTGMAAPVVFMMTEHWMIKYSGKTLLQVQPAGRRK